jgi:hypothetical protein
MDSHCGTEIHSSKQVYPFWTRSRSTNVNTGQTRQEFALPGLVGLFLPEKTANDLVMIQFLRQLDTWSEVSFPFSSRSQTRRVNSGQTRQEFDLHGKTSPKVGAHF